MLLYACIQQGAEHFCTIYVMILDRKQNCRDLIGELYLPRFHTVHIGHAISQLFGMPGGFTLTLRL